MTTPPPPDQTLSRQAPAKRGNHVRRRKVLRWVKRGLLVAGSLAIVGGIALAWMPRPPGVDVAVAREQELETEIVEAGQTRVRDRYVVTSPTTGTLDRVELVAGDPLVVGQTIVLVRPAQSPLLDPRTRAEATARLSAAIARERQARANIDRATVARDAAVTDAIRARTLERRGAITAVELERYALAERMAIADRGTVELERDAAVAAVTAARATLDENTRLDRATPILAPAPGRILRVLRDSAGPIAAGAPVLEIGDPRMLEVVADVLSSDAVAIAPGMPVELDGWGGTRLQGHVRVVEPSGFTRLSALGVEEQRVRVIADLAEPPAALGDGFRVEVRVITWRGTVLAIPSSAVFRHADGWAVYTVDGDRARLAPVQLGHRGRIAVEVTGGLAPGERVILHPSDRVTDGARVAAAP